MASHKTNTICTPIPGPRGWPVIGNVLDIDLNASLKSLGDLAERYGEIFQLSLGGKTHVFVNSVALLNEICDESRFHKQVVMAIEQLRNGAHDGLFTARDGEHNWDLAHRILLPVLGPTKIRDMLPLMQDIGDQLRLKWERYGPAYPIDVTSDFTRLTLDTLALCTMNYRFNSFYRDETVHRFVGLMTEWLRESDNQASLPSVVNDLRFMTKKKLEDKIKEMRQICREIIENRRRHPDAIEDLLNAMLQKTDPATGESLSEESVIDNVITFLVAGHETTSGLLSFTLYFLVSHPLALEKAQKEIDDVVGTGPITIDHLSRLKYLNAVLRETLRFTPTAPAFVVAPYNDDIIGDKYFVPKGQPIWALLPVIHRDPKAHGPDSNEWKPERMLDENFNKLPPHAWKPFGNGKRGCIGRAFAWQESLLTIALLLQKFNFSMVNKDYTLQIMETLTIKPDGFKVFAKLRAPEERVQTTFQNSTTQGVALSQEHKGNPVPQIGNNRPVSILYGSNSGTCEVLAQHLANNARRRLFDVVRVEPLDSATNDIPSGHIILVLTASYDGNPPDNAKLFVDWLMSQKASMSPEVSYAVFGCGHHDWVTTFMKVPTSIDKQLQHLGCRQLVPMGKADTADEDAFSALADWEGNLWKAVGGPSESILSQSQCSYQLLPPVRTGYVNAVVTKVDHLSSPEVPVKAHLEVQLPPDVKYCTGDNLSVLAYNSRSVVQRALARFHLSADSLVTAEASNTDAVIPSGFPVSIAEVFTTYVELSLPASRKNIRRLADIASDHEVKDSLLMLATSTFAERVTAKRLSVLDLLEQYPSISLSVNEFLSMLAPMRPRLYSISSSPAWNLSYASLTWSVLDAPAYSGVGRFQGVASNHLLDLSPGSILRVSIKNSNAQFRPPIDMARSPVIMIASGSGLGPFRAFLQERELYRRGGKSLARALLFFGCRGPDKDDLYRNEFDEFERSGIVRIIRAYSANPAHPEARGCRYIQEALLIERTEVTRLWNDGAFVYVCGGLQMAKEVKEKLEHILLGQSGDSSRTAFTPEESARIVTEAFT